MTDAELLRWNRELIGNAVESLERSIESTQEIVARLRDFLAINPGGQTIKRSAEVQVAVESGTQS